MSAPAVTVVIPTRDRWRFLRQTLEGALSQEGVDVEVIVVDDGSADGTAARLAERADPRLRVLRNERSLGVAAARNRGIDAARGEWVALLDDDDLWSPRKLVVQLEAAAEQDGDWVYCASLVVDEHRRPLRLSIQPVDPEHVAAELLRRNVMPAGSSNVMARAELLRRVGRFDERLHQLADWDLWVRLSGAGRAAVSRELLVAYTEHRQNMLMQSSDRLVEELDYMREKHRERSRAAGVEFDRVALTRWIAWSQRRAGLRGRAVRTYLRGGLAYRNPGNLVRAAAAALGEGAMRGPTSAEDGSLAAPDWLARYA